RPGWQARGYRPIHDERWQSAIHFHGAAEQLWSGAVHGEYVSERGASLAKRTSPRAVHRLQRETDRRSRKRSGGQLLPPRHHVASLDADGRGSEINFSAANWREVWVPT